MTDLVLIFKNQIKQTWNKSPKMLTGVASRYVITNFKKFLAYTVPY